MDEIQFEELKLFIGKTIKDSIETAVKDRFDVLLRKVDSVQGSLDDLSSDTGEDRKDFAQMKISQSTIVQQGKEILDIVSRFKKDLLRDVSTSFDKKVDGIAEAVTENVQPAVQNTLDNFIQTKKSKIEPKVKTIWDKLKFWKK